MSSSATDLNVLGQMPAIRKMAQKDLDAALSGALARTGAERVLASFRYSEAWQFHLAFTRHLKKSPAPGGKARKLQHQQELCDKFGVLYLQIADQTYYATMASADDLLSLFSSIQ